MTPPVTRRDVLALAAAAGTAALAAGCGSTIPQGEATPAPPGAPVSGRLRLYFQGPAAEVETWNSLFALFNEQNPDVELEAVNNIGPDWTSFFSNLQIKLAGGQEFDLIYLPTEGQRLFAAKGLVQPVDAWIERDRDQVGRLYDDIDANLLDQVQRRTAVGGRSYYLPYGFNTMAIWYRRSLLEQAGVAEPEPGWSWEDFLTAARAVAEQTGGRSFSVTPEYFAGIEPWLLTNGTDLLDRDWAASRAADPATLEAVTFTRQLIEEGLSARPGGIQDPLAQFTAGELGLVGFGRWAVSSLRENGADMDDVGIVDWPVRVGQGTPVGWGSLPILRTSRNKDAAWAFVLFMLSDEVQELIARDALSGVVPARRSFATGPAITAEAPAQSPRIYQAVSYASAIPSPDRQNLIESALNDTLRQVYVDAVGVTEGMTRLDSAIETALRP